ncbi:hypothetical protein ACLKA7_016495 [Drosophila subpalustris]
MANGKWPMGMSCSVPGATPCCGPDSEPNPRLVGGSSVDLLRPERQVRGPSLLYLYCSSPRCGNSSCLKGPAMSLSRQTVPGDICASNLNRMPPQQQQQQQPQHRQQRQQRCLLYKANGPTKPNPLLLIPLSVFNSRLRLQRVQLQLLVILCSLGRNLERIRQEVKALAAWATCRCSID